MIEKNNGQAQGGSENRSIYRVPDTRPGCDQNGHKNRTLGNDDRKSGHQEHWKKEEKKNNSRQDL